jgi:hypothetical protein
MLKKTLRGVAITGIALATAVGFTGVAAATSNVAAAEPSVAAATQTVDTDGLTDVPDVNIGNDLCLLPWFWPGPFNVLTTDQTGYYSACNGSGESSGEGINILNNACVAPWLWQGPVNFLTGGLDSYYEACNEYPEGLAFSNAIMQYMTIQYMIDADMLDETAFEPFLQGEITSNDVVLDDGVLAEFEELDLEGFDFDLEDPELDLEDPDAENGLFNNTCLLPWLWQGPFNFMTIDQDAHYEACNR